MDFIDQVKAISEQISKLRDQVKTEEATKSAFVMPLIQALGYNVFNPTEVCPEFIADAPGLKEKKLTMPSFEMGIPSSYLSASGVVKSWATLSMVLNCTDTFPQHQLSLVS